MWLDLARFAESDGFKSDKTRPDAWRFRDWVIRALNADMPYDRFPPAACRRRAGPGDPDAFIATGFNRNYPFEDNNKVPGLNRQLMLDDMTDTTASVFLGLTIGCARCHDHKYDPISQKDYYRFQALFAATEPKTTLRCRLRSSGRCMRRWPPSTRRASRRSARESRAIEQPYLLAMLKDEVAIRFRRTSARRSRPSPRRGRRPGRAAQKSTRRSGLGEGDGVGHVARRPARLAELGAEMKGLASHAPAEPPTGSGMTDTGPDAPPSDSSAKGISPRRG